MTTRADRDVPLAGLAAIPGVPVDPVTIARYVCDMLGGLRVMTAGRAKSDLAFLDYLLAMAESEAASWLPGRIQ